MGLIVYSIGQISEYLGLSRDTIKFYEEKGLVSPKKDGINGYRKYDMEDIHSLFLINFYRDLGIEIKKIQEIKENRNLDDIEKILMEQEKKLTAEIKEKKEKLKKIKNVRADNLNIIKNLDKFSIKEFGPFEVLEEIKEFSLEDAEQIVEKYKNKIENFGISEKAHTLDNLVKEYSFTSEGIVGEKHFVIRNVKKFEGENIIYNKDCLYRIIKMPVVASDKEGERLTMEQFNSFMEKVKEMKKEHQGKVYLKLVLGSFEEGKEMLYLESYYPLK
ncbi:MAG: MerR family transcriptional regulator [Sarcina sp.]